MGPTTPARDANAIIGIQRHVCRCRFGALFSPLLAGFGASRASGSHKMDRPLRLPLLPPQFPPQFLCETLENRTLLAADPLAVRFGGATVDEGTTVAALPGGGEVVGGIFSDTASFGSGSSAVTLTAIGQTAVFVADYSSTGALQWVRQFGGTGGLFKAYQGSTPDFPFDPERSGNSIQGAGPNLPQIGQTIGGVAVDPSGDVYFTGSFYGSVTFNAGTGSKNFMANGPFSGQYPDIFLIKMDANGNLIWGDQMGGEFSDVANAIAVDSSGNAYITGYFSRTANFDPQSSSGGGTFDLVSHGRSDIFAAKYTSAGALAWADGMGSNDTNTNHRNMGRSIAVDSSGNVYITGVFAGVSDFDPGAGVYDLTTPGLTSDFIEKLNSSGGFVWAEQIGSSFDNSGLSLALGPDGSIYTLAYFEGTIQANPGAGAQKSLSASPDNNGDQGTRTNLLMEKLTNSGNLVWAKTITGPGFELGGTIAVDSAGSAYITGAFDYATNFNTNGTPEIVTSINGVGQFDDNNDNGRSSSYDIFLEKLSTNGKFLYVRRFGGAGDDFGMADALTSSDDVLMTGEFRGTVNFNPEKGDVNHLLDAGNGDGFLVEYDSNGYLA